MKIFCTLFLRSNQSSIPPDVFQESFSEKLYFEDLRSAANLARAERLRKSSANWQFIQRNDLPRYYWELSSKEAVKGNDLHEHIAWLLGNLQPGFSLKNLSSMGFEYGLSTYWEGRGTGGGPLIAPKLAKFLFQHNVSLDIGFYLNTEETHDQSN